MKIEKGRWDTEAKSYTLMNGHAIIYVSVYKDWKKTFGLPTVNCSATGGMKPPAFRLYRRMFNKAAELADKLKKDWYGKT
jgi:hypothetical protein